MKITEDELVQKAWDEVKWKNNIEWSEFSFIKNKSATLLKTKNVLYGIGLFEDVKDNPTHVKLTDKGREVVYTFDNWKMYNRSNNPNWFVRYYQIIMIVLTIGLVISGFWAGLNSGASKSLSDCLIELDSCKDSNGNTHNKQMQKEETTQELSLSNLNDTIYVDSSSVIK